MRCAQRDGRCWAYGAVIHAALLRYASSAGGLAGCSVGRDVIAFTAPSLRFTALQLRYRGDLTLAVAFGVRNVLMAFVSCAAACRYACAISSPQRVGLFTWRLVPCRWCGVCRCL